MADSYLAFQVQSARSGLVFHLVFQKITRVQPPILLILSLHQPPSTFCPRCMRFHDKKTSRANPASSPRLCACALKPIFMPEKSTTPISPTIRSQQSGKSDTVRTLLHRSAIHSAQSMFAAPRNAKTRAHRFGPQPVLANLPLRSRALNNHKRLCRRANTIATRAHRADDFAKPFRKRAPRLTESGTPTGIDRHPSVACPCAAKKLRPVHA